MLRINGSPTAEPIAASEGHSRVNDIVASEGQLTVRADVPAPNHDGLRPPLDPHSGLDHRFEADADRLHRRFLVSAKWIIATPRNEPRYDGFPFRTRERLVARTLRFWVLLDRLPSAEPAHHAVPLALRFFRSQHNRRKECLDR
jgi:hypothetical protein